MFPEVYRDCIANGSVGVGYPTDLFSALEALWIFIAVSAAESSFFGEAERYTDLWA